MKALLVAFIAGLLGMLLSWAHYRWSGDSVGMIFGYVLSTVASPFLFATISFAAVALVLGERPLQLLRSFWYWLPVTILLSYVPLFLWIWGSHHGG